MKTTLTSDHPLVRRLQDDIANERARLQAELQSLDRQPTHQQNDSPTGKLARVFALRSA